MSSPKVQRPLYSLALQHVEYAPSMRSKYLCSKCLPSYMPICVQCRLQDAVTDTSHDCGTGYDTCSECCRAYHMAERHACKYLERASMVIKDRTYTKRISSAPGTTPSVATAFGRAIMPAGHTSYMLKLCQRLESF